MYAQADLYDISTGVWSSAGQLSVARFDLAAAAAGNKIVFAGGLYVAMHPPQILHFTVHQQSYDYFRNSRYL